MVLEMAESFFPYFQRLKISISPYFQFRCSATLEARLQSGSGAVEIPPILEVETRRRRRFAASYLRLSVVIGAQILLGPGIAATVGKKEAAKRDLTCFSGFNPAEISFCSRFYRK